MKRISIAIKTWIWVLATLHLQAFWAWGICTLFDNGFVIAALLIVSFLANVFASYLSLAAYTHHFGDKDLERPLALGLTVLLHFVAMYFGQQVSYQAFFADAQPIFVSADSASLSQEGYFFQLTDGQIDHSRTFSTAHKIRRKGKNSAYVNYETVQYKIAPLLKNNSNELVAYICYNDKEPTIENFDMRYTLYRRGGNDYSAQYPKLIDSHFYADAISPKPLYFEQLDLPQYAADFYRDLQIGYIIGIASILFIYFPYDKLE